MTTPQATERFIVVADDDRLSVGDLTVEMQEQGYQVLPCKDFEELRQVLRQLPKTLLFIDIRFGKQHAIERIPELLADAQFGRRNLVVLVTSAVTNSKLALAATKAGAFRYVTKPLRPSLLKLMLQDAFRELDAGGSKPPSQEAAAKAAEQAKEAPVPEYDAFADFTLPPKPPQGDTPLDHISVESGAGSDGQVGVNPGKRYPMERMAVLSNAPEEPGVITFYDNEGDPLMVEWAGNLNQRLSYYVDLHPGLSEVARKAKWFDVFPTMDREQEAKIFDRLVNKLGKFPSLMKEAPHGSSHEGTNQANEPAKSPTMAGRVTQYNASPDRRMLDGIRSILAENPSDPETQDWLAFTLYSNNLLDEAIEWYTKLITKGSRREEHFFYCANAFYKKGDVARAVKLWQVAAKLNPGSAIAQKSAQRLAKAGQMGAKPKAEKQLNA